jgi:hypothetical protein
MTQFYKGQRIAELLNQIKRLEIALTHNVSEDDRLDPKIADAWTSLVIAKAKLTALQGE